jgi:hypothetical protein
MLEVLIPVFLSRDPGARFQIKSMRRDSEADGGIAWQVEAHGGRYSIGSSTISTDLDDAIFLTLRSVDFEPVEADCTCEHDAGPDFIDDDCAYHDWMARVERAAEES